ncbi:Peptidylprolyl isomerase [Balamuthia mandrillaris]
MLGQKKDAMFFQVFEVPPSTFPPDREHAEGPSTNRRARTRPTAPSVDQQQRREEREEKRLAELVVLGWECKLFPPPPSQQQKQQNVNDSFLIPWMGDENLLIDRFDVRALLQEKKLFEKKKKKQGHPTKRPETSNKLAQKIERERYWDMSLHEEDLYKEEEKKRQKMETCGGYASVPFEYGNTSEETAPKSADNKEDNNTKNEENEPYICPFAVPDDVVTPATKKLALVIEHTAKFLVEQPELAAKALKEQQQADNTNFLFLAEGHPLHPFFRLLRQRLEEQQEQERREKEVVVNEMSGSLLQILEYASDEEEQVEMQEQLLPQPPPEVKEVIEKLIPFVAKHGQAFENRVRRGTSASTTSSSVPSSSTTTLPPWRRPQMNPVTTEPVSSSAPSSSTSDQSDANYKFSFLDPADRFHSYYRWHLEAYKRKESKKDEENKVQTSSVNDSKSQSTVEVEEVVEGVTKEQVDEKEKEQRLKRAKLMAQVLLLVGIIETAEEAIGRKEGTTTIGENAERGQGLPPTVGAVLPVLIAAAIEMQHDTNVEDEAQKATAAAAAARKALGKAIKQLLPHERDLLESGHLRNVTHRGASSIWLEAPSSPMPPKPGHTLVYRPMGDAEVLHLVQHNRLPDTQPYQAIIEGPVGREYAEKYLAGRKWVDTSPSTVVEFDPPESLVKTLFERQHKAEDGAISMGLGDKAGGGLPLFNESMDKGETTWRIVKVKRNAQGGGEGRGGESSSSERGRSSARGRAKSKRGK